MSGSELKSGDIFQAKGQGIPKMLEPAYWQVEGTDADGSVRLKGPFADRECTRPFSRVDPITRTVTFPTRD